MAERNDPDSRRAPQYHRRLALTLAAALIVLCALAGAAFSLRHGGTERWVHIALYVAVLAMLGLMIVLLRQNDAGVEVLELTNMELAEAVARSQIAQARAETEASQKTRLAALLDAALGSSPVGFAFVDRDLRFLRVNQTFAALTGQEPADHIGLSLADIDPIVAEQIEPRMREVLDTRRPVVNVEYRLEMPGVRGELKALLGSFYPIITSRDELFGIGVALLDVTENKTLEEQLLQAQKMEAVGRLAGGVAHDFNNLLTVISSYAEIILFDPDAGWRDELHEIQGATKRAAKLTRQLLAFSRRQAMEPRIVNPNDVVRGVETMIRRLVDSNVSIICTLSPDTPLVRVDPGQLEQVVMNLAINAADAMPEGGALTVETTGAEITEARAAGDLPSGNYAVVRVRDTGHGMTQQTIAQIFEPFFTTKEPGKGTGLGLSTVYGIVKQSNGGISVESVVGRGSVFSVYLPAVDGDPEIAELRVLRDA